MGEGGQCGFLETLTKKKKKEGGEKEKHFAAYQLIKCMIFWEKIHIFKIDFKKSRKF